MDQTKIIFNWPVLEDAFCFWCDFCLRTCSLRAHSLLSWAPIAVLTWDVSHQLLPCFDPHVPVCLEYLSFSCCLMPLFNSVPLSTPSRVFLHHQTNWQPHPVDLTRPTPGLHTVHKPSGLPGGASGNELSCQCRRHKKPLGLVPGSGRSPGGGMANHSSILAWKIPWTKEPGGL